MVSTTTLTSTAETLAELLEQLGNVPLDRVRLEPTFGDASEEDLIALNDRKQGLYELLDGVLVRKAMGFYEARMATVLVTILEAWLHQHNLGFTVGPDAMIRFAPRIVRLPDVSVYVWNSESERQVPHDAIADLIPAVAVEIRSKSNTDAEIDRKLQEYFTAGVQQAWVVDPQAQTVRKYESVESFTTLSRSDTLDGGDVLPGFELSIQEWFDRAG